MKWIYQGEEINSLPDEAVGFIYVIHYKDGRKYIGSKLCISERRIKPLVGMRKNAVRTKTVESSWKRYTGSSKLTEGLEIDSKEIITFVKSKRSLTYTETKWLFITEAIESEEYLNANILGKFFKGNLV